MNEEEEEGLLHQSRIEGGSPAVALLQAVPLLLLLNTHTLLLEPTSWRRCSSSIITWRYWAIQPEVTLAVSQALEE
jgi:hypothetical protein